MNDRAPTTAQADLDPVESSADAREDTIPGFQPPSRTRYRPSEAWALRWLGKPAG